MNILYLDETPVCFCLSVCPSQAIPWFMVMGLGVHIVDVSHFIQSPTLHIHLCWFSGGGAYSGCESLCPAQLSTSICAGFQVGVHIADVSHWFSGGGAYSGCESLCPAQLSISTCAGFQVGVHIADVSHFIRPNTAIDREAASRGTTVYLSDQVSGEGGV